MNDNRPTPAVSPSFNAAIDKAVPGFAAELAKQRAREDRRQAVLDKRKGEE